ncbi:uncharacterized protein VTP21DRAFT_3789 [Calcarisporiella thermophila]|uniref:uncharacterized protein n=1 Tax=Calcarisporiella thermophila TaxID=911321 RepID=UPI0037429F40
MFVNYTLAPYVKNSRFLRGMLTPVANWYANLMGYRRYGLKYDDIVIEENDVVREALRRTNAEENNLRAFRFKNAFQASLNLDELPKNQWLKPEDDVRYLKKTIEEVAAEHDERKAFDNINVKAL